MEATQSNPAMALLQQAMELISPKMSIPVVIDYDAITKAAVRTVAEENVVFSSNTSLTPVRPWIGKVILSLRLKG